MKLGLTRFIRRALSIFGIVLIATRGFAIAQNRPACDSIATPGTASWLDSNSDGWGAPGIFTFQQAADGTLSGSYTPPEGAYCQDNFTLRGRRLGYGQFSVTGNNEVGPTTQYCTSTFYGTVTISGLGCAKGTVQWHNSSGLHGDDTLSDAPGIEPTGETTPIPYGQVVNFPALLEFWQNIAPTTYDFQGRLVNESFPFGVTDGCVKNPNSPLVTSMDIAGDTYPTVNGSNGGTPANGITTGYGDDIGFKDTAFVDYLRALGDAPCTISATQLMTIDTAGATYQYQTNTLAYTIGQTTITAARGNPPKSQTAKLLSLSSNAGPPTDILLLLTQ